MAQTYGSVFELAQSSATASMIPSVRDLLAELAKLREDRPELFAAIMSDIGEVAQDILALASSGNKLGAILELAKDAKRLLDNIRAIRALVDSTPIPA